MPQDLKIVYADAEAASLEILEGPLKSRIAAVGSLTCHLGEPGSPEEFVARIGDAEAIILGWGLPDAALTDCPNLKLVAFTGIGAANMVNLPLAAARGITVCNTAGYADQTVAEHTLGLILAAARHIPALDRETRAGTWDHGRPGFDLKGKTLGLVGLGGIGTRTAALARAFGMEVIAWTAHPAPERAAAAGVTFVALDRLFQTSDVVSLHLALTAETEGMIGAGHLSRMEGRCPAGQHRPRRNRRGGRPYRGPRVRPHCRRPRCFPSGAAPRRKSLTADDQCHPHAA